MSDIVRVLQVIETTLSRRGEGVEGSPIRIITEYWTMAGEKIFEIDPCAKVTYPESIRGIIPKEVEGEV